MRILEPKLANLRRELGIRDRRQLRTARIGQETDSFKYYGIKAQMIITVTENVKTMSSSR